MLRIPKHLFTNNQLDTLSLCPEPTLVLTQGQMGTLDSADADHTLCPTVVGDHCVLAHTGNKEDSTRQQCDPEDTEVTNPQFAPCPQPTKQHTPGFCSAVASDGPGCTTMLQEMDH